MISSFYSSDPRSDGLKASRRPLPKMLKGKGLDFSYSGLKTAVINLIHNKEQKGEEIIPENIACSFQNRTVEILTKKTMHALKEKGVKNLIVAGGVAANSGLRAAFEDYSKRYGWDIFVPKFSYTTDNAAMIAITALFKYKDGIFDTIDSVPFSKVVI